MAKAVVKGFEKDNKWEEPWTVKISYDPPSPTDEVICTISYPKSSAWSVYAMREDGEWIATFPPPPSLGEASVLLQAVPTNASDASDPIRVRVLPSKSKPSEEKSDEKRPTYGGTLTINSPVSNTTVSVTFTAAGTINGAASYNVAGSITAGGTTYHGNTTIQGQNWQIAFSQPASAQDALLEVWCVDDTSVSAQTMITIVSGGGGGGGGGGRYNN